MRKKTEDAILNKNTEESGEGAAGTGLLSLFWEFFKIGVFTIGGGSAMIPQMQHVATREKHWLSDEEMLDCIALGQSLPGVIAVNMATYIGYKQRKIFGAVIATLGVTLPAFIAIIVMVAVLNRFGDNKFVEGAFMGVKAAVCGLIIVVAVRLLKQMCRRDAGSSEKPSVHGRNVVFTVVMSLGSLIAVGFFGVTAILVIIVGIVAGIVYYRLTGMGKQEASQK